jgi:hypothetical protein
VGYFHYSSDRSSLGKTANEMVSKANGVKRKRVKAMEKAMKRVEPDEKAISHSRYDEPCLEARVSKGAAPPIQRLAVPVTPVVTLF